MKYTCIFFIFLSFSGLNAQSKIDQSPNVLFIYVDDLGYGDLACQGAKDMQTPNLDKLAKSGMTFTQFYANSTVCSPSRAALLTGKYPDLVGVPGVIRQYKENSWGYLKEDAPFITAPFKEKGYQTAMIGKWHLGFESPNIPNDRGFDYFKGFLGDMMDDYWDHRRSGVNWMRWNKQEIDPVGHATDLFTDWTIEYLRSRGKVEAPFFLYLAYNAPHFPIQPPKDFLKRVQERAPELSEKRAANVAFIEHLDDCIGKVIRYLEDTELLENTLVVFTSDNGGALRYEQSNAPLKLGKQDMFEGGIRVPTFVSWKGKIQADSKIDLMGMQMDFFPTFCEIIGAESPVTLDGMSLLPTLLGETQITDERTVFWVRREGWGYGGKAYYAARKGDYKILQNTPYEPLQFFNIKEDPYETTPLKEGDSEVFKELRKSLEQHIRRSGFVPWQGE